MDPNELQSFLQSRLGSAYTREALERVLAVQRSAFARRLDLFREAQSGRIDGATFAARMNDLAADTVRELKCVLGDRFEGVFGQGADERVILVDPEIAKRTDYTACDPDVLLTMDRITGALREPIRLRTLDLLSEQPAGAVELADRLGVTPASLEGHVQALKRLQLVTGDTVLSASWRVSRIADQHGAPTLLVTDDGGEQQVFWLSLSDTVYPEELAEQLTGDWEYACEATSAEKFSEQELGRGGVMRVDAVAYEIGVDASITATRLWFKDLDGGVHKLDTPVEWKSEGGLSISKDSIAFRYTINGELGMTTDEYEVRDRSFSLLHGTFVHVRSDGGRIRGNISIRKMQNPTDLLWAPDGVVVVP